MHTEDTTNTGINKNDTNAVDRGMFPHSSSSGEAKGDL